MFVLNRTYQTMQEYTQPSLEEFKFQSQLTSQMKCSRGLLRGMTHADIGLPVFSSLWPLFSSIGSIDSVFLDIESEEKSYGTLTSTRRHVACRCVYLTLTSLHPSLIPLLLQTYHAYTFGTSFWYFLRGFMRIVDPVTVIGWFRPPADWSVHIPNGG